MKNRPCLRHVQVNTLGSILAVCLLALSQTAARAIIDRKFTPVDLVRQSEIILAGSLRSAVEARQWNLTGVELLKGNAENKIALRVAIEVNDRPGDVLQLLKQNENTSAVLFAATQDNETMAFLLVGANWLVLKTRDKQEWTIHGVDAKMSGTYAGGADMLIRMSRYILADPDATVPVSAGTCWMGRSRLGTVRGEVAGMATIELGRQRKTCLFVASSQGDRLFQPLEDQDTMEDITEGAGLETRSRCFAWIDMNRDGLADLVSCDGRAIAVHQMKENGTFAPAEPVPVRDPRGNILGLAPIAVSSDGAPGIVVSTKDLPFLLDSEWKKTPMPLHESGGSRGEAHSACIVADLNNDGFADVLQPRQGGGILWMGKRGGFAESVQSPVKSHAGPARFALGDFNGDGFLDVFASDDIQNQLWENDGKAGFKEVIDEAGSLAYKTQPGVSDCVAADLNHDGRPDLALCYHDAGFIYHFNRGYRCMGEEGELRLIGPQFPEGLPTLSVCALAVADFNEDASLDLAVTFVDGHVYCYYNDLCDMPGVVARLKKGVTGPITASSWQGETYSFCTGSCTISGHTPATFIGVRRPGPCTVRYFSSGKSPLSKTLVLGHVPSEIVLDK